MNISGLLELLDGLPAFEQVLAAVQTKERQKPLLLPKSARAAVVAQLYRRSGVPVVLLTGRVDTATAWQQALATWLPDEGDLFRLPEPTPLPFDRGPWSERTRLGRLIVLTRLLAGQHPLIPKADSVPLIVTGSAGAVWSSRVMRPEGETTGRVSGVKTFS